MAKIKSRTGLILLCVCLLKLAMVTHGMSSANDTTLQWTPITGEVTINSIDNAGGTIDVLITVDSRLSDVDRVDVLAWIGDQENGYWYLAKYQEDGRFLATIDIRNHQLNFGTYNINAYINIGDGVQHLLDSTSADIEAAYDVVVREVDEEDHVETTTDYDIDNENYPEEPDQILNGLESRVDPLKPMIALTFDDGVCPEKTPKMLDLLEYYDVRATFFVLGYTIEGNESIIQQAADGGNEVLGHSWRHNNYINLSAVDVREDILSTHQAINSVLGSSARLFRPPFGEINDSVLQVAAGLGFSAILWNLDPQDWLVVDADEIYQYIMDNIQAGAIIVLHDVYLSTIEAMELLIPSLLEKGYQLVTISELFYYSGITLEPGEAYRHAAQ